MRRFALLFAVSSGLLWPNACTLTNTAGSACSSKTCTLSAIAADSTHTNWTGTGCTANGYLPGNGDTVVIPDGYSLTANQNWTIGASGASNTTAALQFNQTGSLTVTSGVTLRARGDLLATSGSSTTAALTLNAGSTLIFDSSQSASPTTTRYRYGYTSNDGRRTFIANGTAASHVTITSETTNGALPGQFRSGDNAVGAAANYGGHNFTATYTDFSYLGDATTYGQFFQWAYWTGGSGTHTMQHCTLSHVGADWGSLSPINLVVHIDHNIWTDSVGDSNLSVWPESASAVMLVTDNAFDKPYNKSVCGGSTDGIVLSGNYFGAGHCVFGTTKTMTDNFIRYPTPYQLTPGGDINGLYMMYDYANSDNPHILGNNWNAASQNIGGVIFEQPDAWLSDSGEACIISAVSGVDSTVTCHNFIVLPTKTGTSPAELGSSAATAPTIHESALFNHNTWIGGPGFGMLQTNEGGAAIKAFASLQSNLAWSMGGNTYAKVETQTLTDPNLLLDPVTTADYNAADGNVIVTNPSCSGCTNQGRGYQGKWTTTPGAHDITALPYFADKWRNVPLFDSKYLGHTAAAWGAGSSYAVGQTVSDSYAGYYGGASVNYRCIRAHTADAGNEPGAGLYRVSGGTLTSITTDGSKALTIHFAIDPHLQIGDQVSIEGSATTDLNSIGARNGIPIYTVASVGSNAVTLSPAGCSTLTANHTYNDAGITVNVWRAFWEWSSLYDLRTATAAGTKYTDGAIGCAGCTAIQALEAWVRRGFTPQNPALWCAGHDGETIGAVAFCAAGKALLGALAGR